MTLLINAYSTLRTPPPLDFPHEFNNHRDRSDPELARHLRGFVGYILHNKERMTQTLYHVMKHIQRVQQHYSLNVEDEHLDAFAGWAWRANAICFIPNGTVTDPSGSVLVYPGDKEPDKDAEVPFPEDAVARKTRIMKQLAAREIRVAPTLPPVLGEGEVCLQEADEVARRMLALFLVAVRAESLATNNELPVAQLHEDHPIGWAALTSAERAFLDDVTVDTLDAKNRPPVPTADSPSEGPIAAPQQAVINFAWRYEALFVLQWALGLVEELPFPDAICDVPLVARLALDNDNEDSVANARLRPVGDILDALDLHLRLHWAVRQARLDEVDPPANLNPGVIAERHHALNWLTRTEDKPWDEIETPT